MGQPRINCCTFATKPVLRLLYLPLSFAKDRPLWCNTPNFLN